jgi:hypothetical protein
LLDHVRGGEAAEDDQVLTGRILEEAAARERHADPAGRRAARGRDGGQNGQRVVAEARDQEGVPVVVLQVQVDDGAGGTRRAVALDRRVVEHHQVAGRDAADLEQVGPGLKG